MGITANYSWDYPDNGGDTNTWGIIATAMYIQQDADLKTVSNAANAAQATATTANTVALRAAPTGAVMDFLRINAPTGWTILNGTIGDASSGADRANADTSALFTALWNDFDDTRMPMLTSAGAASSRGASAAADYSAHKRLTMLGQVNKGRITASGIGTSDIGTTSTVTAGSGGAVSFSRGVYITCIKL